MFSILDKGQDIINVDDLEALQNEIEDILVGTVMQKWQLEQDALALNSTTPDIQLTFASSSSTQPSTPSADNIGSGMSGKLRNSTLHSRAQNLDLNEQTSDALGHSSDSTSLSAYINHNQDSLNAPITEDSIGSEMSMDSSQTGTTIIVSTHMPESNQGSQNSNTSSTSQVAITNKRSQKGADDKLSSKRFRPNNSTSGSLSAAGTYAKRIHSKSRSKVVPSKFQRFNDDSRSNHVLASRNEAPDKLWPFVEQFCSFPTELQIKELEEMILSIDNDKEFYKVPALAKKNSSKDSPTKSESGKIKEAQSTTNSPSTKSPSKGSKSSQDVEPTSASNNKTAGQSGVATGNKKTSGKTAPCNNDNNRHAVDEEAGLGALTQRLVSCLIEESTDNHKESDSNTTSNSKKKISKAKGRKVDLNNAKSLEKRIRQELEEYQILSQKDDIPYRSEDDEVLRELRACQHELALIQAWNKESMSQLARKARKHFELDETREKLKEANADVIAAYVKLIQAKQRKRNPTKKEKDSAWKALKVQDAIYKKCEELYLSNLSKSLL